MTSINENVVLLSNLCINLINFFTRLMQTTPVQKNWTEKENERWDKRGREKREKSEL